MGLIFQRIRLYRQTRQAQASFEERFWSGMDLGQLYKEVCASPRPQAGGENVFRAGFKEFSRLRQQSEDGEAVMDGTQRAMKVALSRSLKSWNPICRFWQRSGRPVLMWACLAPSGAS